MFLSLHDLKVENFIFQLTKLLYNWDNDEKRKTQDQKDPIAILATIINVVNTNNYN